MDKALECTHQVRHGIDIDRQSPYQGTKIAASGFVVKAGLLLCSTPDCQTGTHLRRWRAALGSRSQAAR